MFSFEGTVARKSENRNALPPLLLNCFPSIEFVRQFASKQANSKRYVQILSSHFIVPSLQSANNMPVRERNKNNETNKAFPLSPTPPPSFLPSLINRERVSSLIKRLKVLTTIPPYANTHSSHILLKTLDQEELP
jgi:hypothetical protein